MTKKSILITLLLIGISIQQVLDPTFNGKSPHNYDLIFKKFSFKAGEKDMTVMPTLIKTYQAAKMEANLVIDTAFEAILLNKETITKTGTLKYNSTDIDVQTENAILNLETADDSKSVKLQVNYAVINKIPNWSYANSGLLGLAPKSPFWNYLGNSYSTDSKIVPFKLSVVTKAKKESFSTDEKNFDKSQIIVGGNRITTSVNWVDNTATQAAYKTDVADLPAFWFPHVSVKFHSTYHPNAACILSDSNFAFAVPETIYKNFGIYTLNKLCGISPTYDPQTKKFSESCSKDNKKYDLTKVKDLKFNFNDDTEIALWAQQILIMPGKDAKKNAPTELGFTIITDEMNTKCGFSDPNVSNIILGKQFLTGAEFLVEVGKDGITQFGVGPPINPETAVAAFIFIFVGVGVTILLVMLVLRGCNGSESEEKEEDEYLEAGEEQ